MNDVYIDSDGVISDFNGWASQYGKTDKSSILEVDRIMLDHYDEVFLKAKELPHAEFYLYGLRNFDNFFVLTAIPSLERLKEEYPNEDDIDYKVRVMTENKYKWFEERGVPRDKVIICSRASHKALYCKKGDILIDDRKNNINKWNKAEGIGIYLYNYKNKES